MMSRTDLLAEKIKDETDAVLIFSEENRKYFTHFSASDGALLIFNKTALFFTDSRYTEAASAALGNEQVIDSSNLYEKLGKIFTDNNIRKVAIENDRLTLAEFDRLKERLPDISFVSTDMLSRCINDIREIKSDKEVFYIQQAQKIAEDAFSHIIGFIRPGITEKEISLELDFYMLSHGAEALSFETIAVAGKNSSMPHGVPGEYIIQNGDFITLDYGAVVNGYHSDMTRTVAVGFVSDKQREIYNTVLKAQTTALSAVKAGVGSKYVDKIARDIITEAGMGNNFGHGLGHGVGIEIHESPSLSPRSEYILKPGNIVTVEPGIYIPGEFGVRIEDMVLVTDEGHINLTSCPKELIIL